MIAYLFKPFGYDKYLVLSKQEELNKFFGSLLPGDEFILKAVELSEEEFGNLDKFDGF